MLIRIKYKTLNKTRNSTKNCQSYQKIRRFWGSLRMAFHASARSSLITSTEMLLCQREELSWWLRPATIPVLQYHQSKWSLTSKRLCYLIFLINSYVGTCIISNVGTVGESMWWRFIKEDILFTMAFRNLEFRLKESRSMQSWRENSLSLALSETFPACYSLSLAII